ncbi:MAG: DUF2148 domain-containing protein [Rikenellaceae bacterium]|nr:DUF2148 domain-containing protein [Rikenellaceae bacterium]
MILDEQETRSGQVLAVARAMMAAARTAPKGKGLDFMDIKTVTDEDLAALAYEMRAYGERSGMKFFLRDAGNVEQSECVVLLGTGIGVMGLNCGYCGFSTCAAKLECPTVPCALNPGDLGIAIGSAVSVAADNRIDNRILFSAGRAALNLGWLPGCTIAYGIVLSCTSKNPFFDRAAHKPEAGK